MQAFEDFYNVVALLHKGRETTQTVQGSLITMDSVVASLQQALSEEEAGIELDLQGDVSVSDVIRTVYKAGTCDTVTTVDGQVIDFASCTLGEALTMLQQWIKTCHIGLTESLGA